MNYQKVKKLIGMLLVAAMLLPVIPVSPVYADTSTEWELVGSGPLSSPYSRFTSLFINDGIPYIAFSDEVSGDVRLVAERFVGNQWETVGFSRYAAGSVQDGTVYVDEDTDTPYLAYITYLGDVVVLKLADFGEIIDWTTVGRTNSSGASGLSVYVHDGVSYVAYADTSDGYRAVVKKFQGGSKVPVTPVQVGDVGETSVSFLSMKGDAAGNLYLVFESSPSDRIKVMKKPYASDTWSMVGDFVSPGRTYGPSLYLYEDGSGDATPYVAYADAQSDYRPIVKKFVGDEWVTVGDDYVSEDDTWETSLYVDGDGTPYVAYVIGEGEYSRVFKLDNNSWVPVGGDGYASDGDSSGISLAVWNGVPYLSYVDYENDGKAVVRRYAPPAAPTVSSQPSDQTVIAGQTATFTVTAAGTQPFTYQWFKDKEPIVGANSSILRITDAQESDEGVYTCNIRTAIGDINTAGARLAVNEPGGLVFTATPGDRHVSLTWNGVPGASSYQIYQDTALIGTVLNNAYDAAGLTNGTTYSFAVKALDVNSVVIASSGAVSATPYASSGSSGDHRSSSSGLKSSNSGADILVNGKVENAGTASTTTQGGKTVTTVTVDSEKLKQKLDAEGDHSVVTIPVNTASDVVIGELNGEMVKNMENKQAVIEVKTGAAAYTLPAQQINIKAISEQLGQNVALGDIKVQIEIAESAANTVQVAENSAQKGSFTLVVQPVDFTVRCTYGNKTVEVSQFNNYVERTVAIPDGVDPNKITTGVVVDPDGTVRHMPTRITVIDGRYYAVINSLTNSTYSVVWHPLEFKDVAKHWAKEAVNDMGSRMVIDGIGNGLFEPNRDITRAEFAAIVVRGLGLKPGTGENPFSDVKSSAWYSNSIETASAYGLITGYGNDTFRPMEKITREQAMTIVGRAMEITGLKQDIASGETNAILASFGDSDKTSSWAKESTAACIKEGIVAGKTGNLLVPKANITRAEVAAIISRLLKESDLIN